MKTKDHPLKTKDHPSNGFSLLEVLLAILVLGIALTVFFSAANQGVAATLQAREYQTSREMLEELELREPLDLEEFEEGITRGTFRHSVHGRVNWTRTVTIEGKEEDGFFRLTTKVSRGEDEAVQEESIETFLHLPSATKGGWVKEPFDEF